MLRYHVPLLLVASLLACQPSGTTAQVCEPTDAALALVPAEPPAELGYGTPPPEPTPFEEPALGIGHLCSGEDG
jgi:hypothetical protein